MGLRPMYSPTMWDPTDVLAGCAGALASAGAYTGLRRALKRPSAPRPVGMALFTGLGFLGGLAANNYRIESAMKHRAWVAEHDPASGEVYYFNKITGESD